MTDERAKKIDNIRHFIPKQALMGSIQDSLLVVSWGGTFGSVSTAVDRMRKQGASVAHVHIKYLNPVPANLEEIIGHFKHVIVFELNNRQLVNIIRSQFAIAARKDSIGYVIISQIFDHTRGVITPCPPALSIG